MHELAGMLQRIYHLGDRQAYQLREAMRGTCAINGIGTNPFAPTPQQQYLPFEAIRDVLVRERLGPTACTRADDRHRHPYRFTT